jgi:hypothetical protein
VPPVTIHEKDDEVSGVDWLLGMCADGEEQDKGDEDVEWLFHVVNIKALCCAGVANVLRNIKLLFSNVYELADLLMVLVRR